MFGFRDAILVALLVIVTIPLLFYKPLREDCIDAPLGTRSFDVYLINLERDSIRLKSFDFMYRQTDLSKRCAPIKFTAIDGRRLDIQPLVTPKAYREIMRAEKVKYRSKHYELTRGAVGCWLSHVGVWKQFLESDKEIAMICEDDCIIVADYMEQLHRVRPPLNWDIVVCGYVCNKCHPQECGDALRVQRFFGLHCYFITRAFATKFFASPYSKSIGKQIDSVLSDMIADGSINVYATRKKIAWQNNRHGTRIQMPLGMVPGVDVWE